MMAKTHISFAFSIATLPIIIDPSLINLITKETFGIVTIGIFFGSLFPDIDEPNSRISKMSFITLVVSWAYVLLGNKHRGITHKFIFFLFFLLVSSITINLIPIYTTTLLFSFSFGILAHQLGDMMVGGGKNKGGIYNYFAPFTTANSTTKFLPKILRCKINGIKEHLYLIVFTAVNFYAATQTLSQILKS